MHVGCRTVQAGCKGRARHKPGKLLPGEPQPGYPPQAVEGDLGPFGLQLLPWPPSALSYPEVPQGRDHREGQRGPSLPPLRVSIQLQLGSGLLMAGPYQLPLRRLLRCDCCSANSGINNSQCLGGCGCRMSAQRLPRISTAITGHDTCSTGNSRSAPIGEDVAVEVGEDGGCLGGFECHRAAAKLPHDLLQASPLLGPGRCCQRPRNSTADVRRPDQELLLHGRV